MHHIKNILKKTPELTYSGFGLCSCSDLSKLERIAEKKRSREFLLSRGAEFNRVCEWLKTLEKTKTINNRRSSYSLKNIFEKLSGRYVSNGAFITGALHCGFKHRQNDINAYFNIAEKSIKKTIKKIRETDPYFYG